MESDVNKVRVRSIAAPNRNHLRCKHWRHDLIHLIQKRLLWALAIGHWEAIVWRSLKQSISLFSYAQTIASQYPIANFQSNLFQLGVGISIFVPQF